MIHIDIKKKIKTFNGVNLLQIKTSFALKSITQVLGNSGAGKTTFLKMIAGLVRPDEGFITVNDETWVDTTAHVYLPTQKRNVGFVFQDYALFPNMTVEQHLLYGTQDVEFTQQLLRIGRMETFLNHRPPQLSGGQQQRLAILRALSTKPRILLMDEPFSALDNVLKSTLMDELKQMVTDLGITCIVVTHQPFADGEFADSRYMV